MPVRQMKRRLIRIILAVSVTGTCAAFAARGIVRHYRPKPVAAAPAGLEEIRFNFDGAQGSDGIPAPWQSKVIHGSLQAEVTDATDGPGGKALRVKCDKSHFLLWDQGQPFDPKDYPFVSWSWKANTLPTGGDVRKHALLSFMGENRNDAVVQVLIGFEGNKVLSYIWDSTAPVGTEVQEPSPVATVKTQVLDSGPAHLSEWVAHRVNIYKDYQRRFGDLPGKVLGISIQTNSNHTESMCDGMIADIAARRD
jgi:Protein of unknown function (DUF3047)